MNAFEFDGEKYKKASKHQNEWGNSLIAGLPLGGNEEILDLGCGDGSLTEQLAQLVPNGRVLGIDASVGMIDTAKNRIKPNLTFMKMDLTLLIFRACSMLYFQTQHFIGLKTIKDFLIILLKL